MDLLPQFNAVEIRRAYTLKGVPVSVKAVANVKIRGDDTSLQTAAERFLGMTHDQVQKVIFQTLEGHLRSILGTLAVEEVNSDRQSFAQKLTSEAAVDLEKMGIGLQTILEKMPAIIEASRGIFSAVAAPIGNIDKLVVIDQGNGHTEGGSGGLGRIARTSPAVVFGLLQQLEALGLNVPSVLQQLGVSSTAPAASTPEPAAPPPSSTPRK